MIVSLLVVICLVLLLGREKTVKLLIALAVLTVLVIAALWIYFAPARERHRREIQAICKQNPKSDECMDQ